MYDYRCDRCGDKFTVLIRWDQKGAVRCPSCDATEVKELYAPFATATSGRSGSGSNGAGCGTGGFS